MLDLPDISLPAPPAGGMLWGDGFEIETVLNCRVAAAGMKITEVPSMERERIFGQTNLRTFADGTRVLRTLAAEHRRATRKRVERVQMEVRSRALTPPGGIPVVPQSRAGGSAGAPQREHAAVDGRASRHVAHPPRPGGRGFLTPSGVLRGPG